MQYKQAIGIAMRTLLPRIAKMSNLPASSTRTKTRSLSPDIYRTLRANCTTRADRMKPIESQSDHAGTQTNQETGSHTVDQKEVKHFKTFSWWSDGGDAEVSVLIAMNRLRVPFVRDCLVSTGKIKASEESPKPLTNMTILDVGCGGGYFAEPLARLGATVKGIDATEAAIDAAKQHAAKYPQLADRLTYEYTTIEEHSPQNTHKYDVIVSSEVIEHITNKEAFVKECTRCLKPGGSIILTTINKTLASKLGAIWFAENVMKIIPAGTHEYEKLISPSNLRKMLEDNNCATKVVHGIFYNPLLRKWYWTKSTAINYAIHAVKSL